MQALSSAGFERQVKATICDSGRRPHLYFLFSFVLEGDMSARIACASNNVMIVMLVARSATKWLSGRSLDEILVWVGNLWSIVLLGLE